MCTIIQPILVYMCYLTNKVMQTLLVKVVGIKWVEIILIVQFKVTLTFEWPCLIVKRRISLVWRTVAVVLKFCRVGYLKPVVTRLMASEILICTKCKILK